MRLAGACIGAGYFLAVFCAGSQEAESSMSAFGKWIPQGFVNRNVVIPSFNDGKLGSRLTAATLVRLDDDRLEAGRTVIEIYGDTPPQDTRVEMPGAIFHMTANVLRSGERSRVIRSDFEAEGDSMVFDATTSIGAMKGRVKTFIFDTGPQTGQSKQSQPGAD
ncbi:MAG TPA: hypothetical protein DIT64_06050 [Verrucomicrobiales bacterium]|nr:hypothetical protein [Verrucomicrobiales bacterium]